jgi:hypothetical protein
MNVLSQYSVGTGAGSAGTFVASSSVSGVPNQLDAAGIARVIQSLIDSGSIPEPPQVDNNLVLVIYLDETIAVKSRVFACANAQVTTPSVSILTLSLPLEMSFITQ